MPKLLFVVEDMACPGGIRVFQALDNPASFLQTCIINIYKLLYTKKSVPTNIRSITFTFRSMDGVAYTTGSRLDNDHKEIHFSTNYISNIDASRLSHEVQGVLLHELVHCFQQDGKGKCPGGLIEGIADWVRLKGGFAPPHWKRAPPSKWDDGYERTAFFLEWIEQSYGATVIRKLNECMCEEYEDELWKTLTGHSIDSLWKKYLHEYDAKATKDAE